jgi:hypothetical protein
MTCCVVVIGFSLSLSWIRLFVPSLWKPSACPCFIQHVKRPWTHYWMLKSTCKCLIDWMWKSLLTSCLCFHRYSSKGTVVKKVSLINKGLFHLIDDIFWNLGFKNETHADKVTMLIRIIRIISTIRIKRFMSIILIISIISQVRAELGIPDHVWTEQRAVIASSIDGLGDRFNIGGQMCVNLGLSLHRFAQVCSWVNFLTIFDKVCKLTHRFSHLMCKLVHQDWHLMCKLTFNVLNWCVNFLCF